MIPKEYTDQGATFSTDRAYRYTLWRRWAPGETVHWLMLNPSTADETVLDPTVTRCVGYAQAWGYGAIRVSNIFALRSTDPKALYKHDDPVGPDNDEAIMEQCRQSRLVIAAWGTHGKLKGRGEEVFKMLDKRFNVHAMHVTKAGHPGHPLYLPGDRKPGLYRPF